MASTQVTLGGAVTTVNIPNPTGRIVLTLIGGVAAEFWVTTDGNVPVPPASGVFVTDNQKTCAGVLGTQIVLTPQLFGDHMVAPTLLLASAGNPVVEIEW